MNSTYLHNTTLYTLKNRFSCTFNSLDFYKKYKLKKISLKMYSFIDGCRYGGHFTMEIKPLRQHLRDECH